MIIMGGGRYSRIHETVGIAITHFCDVLVVAVDVFVVALAAIVPAGILPGEAVLPELVVRRLCQAEDCVEKVYWLQGFPVGQVGELPFHLKCCRRLHTRKESKLFFRNNKIEDYKKKVANDDFHFIKTLPNLQPRRLVFDENHLGLHLEGGLHHAPQLGRLLLTLGLPLLLRLGAEGGRESDDDHHVGMMGVHQVQLLDPLQARDEAAVEAGVSGLEITEKLLGV